VKFKRPRLAPTLLVVAVLALVCGVRLNDPDFLDQVECKTYDLRVRTAEKFPAPAATNLAFVSMEESSIAAVKNGKVGFHFGLYWPREVYGRLVDELTEEGAQAVAFDILFAERRTDHPPVQMADGRLVESDDFFARQLHRAGNTILAATPEIFPHALFATNAFALGGITTEKDADGTLRRVQAFRDLRRWHRLFQKLAADPEIRADLTRARLVPGKILLPQTDGTNVITVEVDAENNFHLADFIGDQLPPGLAPTAKAFTDTRVWQMGIVLAAQELKLDLAQAEVDLPHGKIILRGANGLERVIPVDGDGDFYIDWQLTPNDPRLAQSPIENLLGQDHQRLLGQTNGLKNDFAGKLVVVGSAAQGNDLTDRGATPLEKDTLLVSKHWNVANSIITGRFVYRLPLPVELALILFLGGLTALVTWQLRAVTASVSVLLLLAGFTALAFFLFVKFRWWLPLVYPLGGAVLLQHFALVIHRVVFEEKEKRRVKSVFSKIVSPDVVNELLGADKISLGGTRRELTVLFSDVRGFTSMTDEMQQFVEEFIREQRLDAAAAEKCVNEFAQETLATVNLYLATVADAVKQHGGTLDKYIGDCVMAFWGAPLPNENHAAAAVRAAIDAQRALAEVNRLRTEESAAREIENRTRRAAGLPPKPPLRAMQLGTGINTGFMTVGLMGSDQHILNYTVFGREVNLASRLESASGSGRILISETTRRHLQQHDPILAATCVELEPAHMKGFQDAVRNFEVPWK